jgi:hypothetical protein
MTLTRALPESFPWVVFLPPDRLSPNPPIVLCCDLDRVSFKILAAAPYVRKRETGLSFDASALVPDRC